MYLDINDLDVNVFLGPFLEVIRSEETTGPMTGVALSAVNKFLSYGLLGLYYFFFVLLNQYWASFLGPYYICLLYTSPSPRDS